MPASNNNAKACHNCRRRRLRCDRSWPTCNKCLIGGLECLGYGKIFVWTQPDDASAASGPPPPPASFPPDFLRAALPPPPDGQHATTIQASGGRAISREDDDDGAAAKPTITTLASPLSRLTDPIFQDLDHNSRYYLTHFANRVCQDLVARDGPGLNPFRELIPLTNKHPLLQQIVIATSAIHWVNIFRPAGTPTTGISDPGGYMTAMRSKDLVAQKALADALTARQKALGYMRELLETLDAEGSELALAAMHFFIKFDLIDTEMSDTKNWQAHLEGASSLLALSPDGMNSPASQMLRDYVVADYFIYHILGSTLTSGAHAARMARHAVQLLPVMKRVEMNIYLACPPEILQAILVASQLSYEKAATDETLTAADEAIALFDQAVNYDMPSWVAHLQAATAITDTESRIHVASAYRSSACLYVLQALPPIRAVRPLETQQLVEDILNHLSFIDDADPYFKAISWPLFIAGAESKDPEKRKWVMERLLRIWKICPWGYLFTAIEMLKAAWELRDTRPETEVNWLQELKRMGFDYLII